MPGRAEYRSMTPDAWMIYSQCDYVNTSAKEKPRTAAFPCGALFEGSNPGWFMLRIRRARLLISTPELCGYCSARLRDLQCLK